MISAADGDAGLALLLDELLALDVLVVAADLPGRDARAFAELIRRAGGERDLSIVVVGATRQHEDELLAAGVDRVLAPTAAPGAAAEAVAAVVAARRNAGASLRATEPPASIELELEEPPARTQVWSLPLRGMALLAS